MRIMTWKVQGRGGRWACRPSETPLAGDLNCTPESDVGRRATGLAAGVSTSNDFVVVEVQS